jgi:hypothetical protein
MHHMYYRTTIVLQPINGWSLTHYDLPQSAFSRTLP